MTFSTQLHRAMEARRGLQLGASRPSSQEGAPVDLGSGPRGTMPLRGESVNDHLRRRAAELRGVERVVIPRSAR
jgi:hypothetical protein